MSGKIKHGGCRTRLYGVWARIKQKCYDRNAPQFAYYGARGIKMYKSWRKDFAIFSKYIEKYLGGDRPGFEIGRIKNNQGYKPGNIRWETKKQNGRNKRNNVMLMINGKKICLSEACEIYSVPYQTAWQRIKRLNLKDVKKILSRNRLPDDSRIKSK